MILISLALAALAFGISFAALRKKKMSARVLGAVLLGLALVGGFLALIVLGGDSAEPGAVTYTEGK